jgi:hypothetical protein
MIRCEQCFYRYPAGTLFCDVCGAALSPWLLERDADIANAALPADDVQFTFDEPSLAPLPFSPYARNSGRLVSDSDLLGVGVSPSGRLYAQTPEVTDEAPSDERQQRQQHQDQPQPGQDERRHARTRGSGADEILVGMEAAPKCVWVILTGGQTFELAGKAQYLIGRRDPANNVMPDVDLTNWYGAANGVSRVHASLYITPIGVFVEDLESRNETMRNEDRLLPRQRYALKDGDVLRLGQMVLHVQFAEEP